MSPRVRVALLALVALGQVADLLTFAAAMSAAPIAAAESNVWARTAYATTGLTGVLMLKAVALLPILLIVDYIVTRPTVRLAWKVFIPALAFEWGAAGAVTNVVALLAVRAIIGG